MEDKKEINVEEMISELEDILIEEFEEMITSVEWK